MSSGNGIEVTDEMFNKLWDVIEALEEVGRDYAGTSEIYKKGKARIMPDSTGAAIVALQNFKKQYPIKRVSQWQQQ